LTSYYRLLGVPEGADASAIKGAYRNLARKYHPDHNNGHPLSERRFRLLAEAYEVLSDDEKRQKYDRFGPSALTRRGGEPGIVGNVQRLVTNIEQALESRMKQVRKRGEDRRVVLDVSLSQAVFGASLTVQMRRRVRCDRCQATGAEPGTSLEACHVCAGQGRIKSGSGLLAVENVCPFCESRGRIAPSPCSGCEGMSELDRVLDLPVQVPPGTQPGRRLVLRGYGEPGQAGGEPGDLFVELAVKPHALLQREGQDLRCSVPISIAEAVLGGEATVPVLEGGTVTVRVPPRTRSGQTLRIRGRGCPSASGSKGERGDLLVKLEVETPVVDSAVALELLSRLEQVSFHPERAEFRAALRRHLEP
jgi:molecular chaperone DnaJ